MYAALRGKADLIKGLIELGADPEQTDIHGKSALDFAREYSKDECIKILFQEREKNIWLK
jgi:ankyrin repeat protein